MKIFRSSVLTQSREDKSCNGHSEALQHVPNVGDGCDPAHTWNTRFGNNFFKLKNYNFYFFYLGDFLPQVYN